MNQKKMLKNKMSPIQYSCSNDSGIIVCDSSIDNNNYLNNKKNPGIVNNSTENVNNNNNNNNNNNINNDNINKPFESSPTSTTSSNRSNHVSIASLDIEDIEDNDSSVTNFSDGDANGNGGNSNSNSNSSNVSNVSSAAEDDSDSDHTDIEQFYNDSQAIIQNILSKNNLNNVQYDKNGIIVINESYPSSLTDIASTVNVSNNINGDNQLNSNNQHNNNSNHNNYNNNNNNIPNDNHSNMLNNLNSNSSCSSSINNTGNKQPQIGSIAVQNSTDVTIGNKTFYQGPIKIKQYHIENNKWKAIEKGRSTTATTTPTGNDENGQNNEGFQDSNGDLNQTGKLHEPTNNGGGGGGANRTFAFCSRRPVLITLIIMICVLGSMALTAVFIWPTEQYPGDGDDYRTNLPINTTIGDDILTDENSSLKFVTRSEWLARPPNPGVNQLELPSLKVIIAHTATDECMDQATCTHFVRQIQNFHMNSRGWSDISYNVMVAGDGSAYEGRGFDLEGAHTRGFNTRSICIAFIGTFNIIVPPDRQIIAAKKVIREAINLNKLITNYTLYGHRQLISTQSPGSALYAIIKTWDHWTNKI